MEYIANNKESIRQIVSKTFICQLTKFDSYCLPAINTLSVIPPLKNTQKTKSHKKYNKNLGKITLAITLSYLLYFYVVFWLRERN